MKQIPIRDPVPRTLEAILKLANVNGAFLDDLVRKRSALIESLNIPLDPSEKTMLDTVPEDQLRAIVVKLTVPPDQKRILLGAVALGAAILGLLAYLVSNALPNEFFQPITAKLTGSRSDIIDLAPSGKTEIPSMEKVRR